MERDVLTAADIEQFHATGVIRVRGAFPRALADTIRDQIWDRVERIYPARRNDPATWRGTWAGKVGKPRIGEMAGIGSARLTAAFDQLLGVGGWRYGKLSHGVLASGLDDPSAPWVVAGLGWHWDYFWRGPWTPSQGLMFFPIFSELEPRGTGTLLLEGSRQWLDDVMPTMTTDEVARPYGKDMMRTLLSRHPFTRKLVGLDLAPNDPGWFFERFVITDARCASDRSPASQATSSSAIRRRCMHDLCSTARPHGFSP